MYAIDFPLIFINNQEVLAFAKVSSAENQISEGTVFVLH